MKTAIPTHLTPGSLHVSERLLDVPGDGGGAVLDPRYLRLCQPQSVPQIVLVVFVPVNLPVPVNFVQREEDFEVVPHCFLRQHNSLLESPALSAHRDVLLGLPADGHAHLSLSKTRIIVEVRRPKAPAEYRGLLLGEICLVILPTLDTFSCSSQMIIL